jgi:NTP pyrophosphatase (non-canonical NTP hydrolase)
MNGSPLSGYPTFVKGLVKNRATGIEGYLHAAVGMSGESGEVLDMVKKTWVSNKPLDTDKLKHEAGDVLFYLQHLCNLLGVSLEEIAALNIKKLSARYPHGYSDAASAARVGVMA